MFVLLKFKINEPMPEYMETPVNIALFLASDPFNFPGNKLILVQSSKYQNAGAGI
jgi:hypothetical protein